MRPSSPSSRPVSLLLVALGLVLGLSAGVRAEPPAERKAYEVESVRNLAYYEGDDPKTSEVSKTSEVLRKKESQ